MKVTFEPVSYIFCGLHNREVGTQQRWFILAVRAECLFLYSETLGVCTKSCQNWNWHCSWDDLAGLKKLLSSLLMSVTGCPRTLYITVALATSSHWPWLRPIFCSHFLQLRVQFLSASARFLWTLDEWQQLSHGLDPRIDWQNTCLVLAKVYQSTCFLTVYYSFSVATARGKESLIAILVSLNDIFRAVANEPMVSQCFFLNATTLLLNFEKPSSFMSQSKPSLDFFAIIECHRDRVNLFKATNETLCIRDLGGLHSHPGNIAHVIRHVKRKATCRSHGGRRHCKSV